MQPMMPGFNPIALLGQGQQQMTRALGGNPYDTQAMAQVLAQGLEGAGALPNQGPMQRGSGFNPIGAL